MSFRSPPVSFICTNVSCMKGQGNPIGAVEICPPKPLLPLSAVNQSLLPDDTEAFTVRLYTVYPFGRARESQAEEEEREWGMEWE